MYYRIRRQDGRKEIHDEPLRSKHWGASGIIIGNAPSLLEANLDHIRGLDCITIAINNAAATYRDPDYWIGVDPTYRFEPEIFQSSITTLIGDMASCDTPTILGGDDHVWETYPMVFFKRYPEVKFFDRNARGHVQHGCSFIQALQLAFRLGLSRVYLVGCGFRIDPEKMYAVPNRIKGKDAAYWAEHNKKVYPHTVERLKQLADEGVEHGFEVINSTPDSVVDFLTIVDIENIGSEQSVGCSS